LLDKEPCKCAGLFLCLGFGNGAGIKSDIMEFLITKTSLWNYEEQPITESYSKMIPNWDQRSFKTEEEHDNKLGVPWRDKGTNHEINNIGIRRQFGEVKRWFIQINSLEELRYFVNKYGKLIISEDEIEIYDDYRE
jgi:hypothetical protein